MDNNGYYTVGNQIIGNKIQALIASTQTNIDVKYHFYDDVFQNIRIDRTQDISLEELYKQRALQLRESYDYLILNYSGGGDSYNILRSFIDNNIKLDHIFVYWHTSLVDKNLYNVNSLDTSNENFHSEWDLVIKKDLEYIANKHPEITIEIKDWTLDLNENFYNDYTLVSKAGNPMAFARTKKLFTFSDTETRMADKGLKVASIYGTEKPFIVWKDNRFYFYFKDKMGVHQPNPNNPFGTEYFYTTPNFPELTVAQAHLVADFFKTNMDKFFLVKAPSLRPEKRNFKTKDYYNETEEYREIVKHVCYPKWDFNRFQSGKPCPGEKNLPIGLKLWDILLQKAGILDRAYDAYKYHWTSYVKSIDPKFFKSNEEISIHTRWHYLEDFVPPYDIK